MCFYAPSGKLIKKIKRKNVLKECKGAGGFKLYKK